MTIMRAIGLMSGTSMDGIDLAVLDTDGERALERHPTLVASRDYREDERQQIAAAMAAAAEFTAPNQHHETVQTAARLITSAHAEIVNAFLADHPDLHQTVRLIGFHGQTVLHRPDAGFTLQIGDGAELARQTGIDVVYDFRSADMAAGGEGAPLAPVYHLGLAKDVPGWPVAFLNLGGVGNVTWIGRHGDMLAFDTGPGNALLDDWCQRFVARGELNQNADIDGDISAGGRVDEDVLIHLMRQPYFSEGPPKSLDRNTFPLDALDKLSLKDGAATLARFTIKAVAQSRAFFTETPGTWVVCGGGRKNRTLMTGLAELLDGLVVPAEAVGLNGDMLEAEAFAYLAVRSKRGLPLSYPTTTGVPEPTTGGVLAKA